MSELSREQVEEQCRNIVYASNGDEGTHAAANQLQYTDAALRAKLEAMTEERDEAVLRCNRQWISCPIFTKTNHLVSISWPEGAQGAIMSRELVERFVQYANELAASEQRVKELEQQLHLTRGAMLAQDARELAAGARCGVPYLESGCDWPDTVAEVVQSLRHQLAAMTIERNDLDDTRQGLEAELSYMTQGRNEVRLRRQETVNMAVQLELEIDRLKQQLTEARATIAQLEQDNKLHRSGDNYIQLEAERDQLQATVTAQQEELGRVREEAP